jgi:hypothetical protein
MGNILIIKPLTRRWKKSKNDDVSFLIGIMWILRFGKSLMMSENFLFQEQKQTQTIVL